MGASASIQTDPVKSGRIIPFPYIGVKLSFLEELYELCGGKEKLREITSADFNEIYLKKLTERYGISFCEYLTSLNHPAVGCNYINAQLYLLLLF